MECSGRRVMLLVIPFLDLRGPLDPLSHLDQLCRLDLNGNRLNGTLLPLLPVLPNLKLLYLSQNDGPIPNDALANLTHLLTLCFQNNLLSGQLSDLSSILPHLLEFNASNNQLYDRVPDSMRTPFGIASFAGNAGIYGPAPLLPPCSFMLRNSPPSSPSSQLVVPSNPNSESGISSNIRIAVEGDKGRHNREGLSRGPIISIAARNAMFLLVVRLPLKAC